MSRGPVVVTGATGTVGRFVVDELVAQGVAVRAASRTPRSAARVEDVRFSFTDPATWGAAFDGASGLFLMRPPQIGKVRRDLLPAVAAARSAGVRQVVFLSVLGAEHNPLLPHRVVERWLDGSGMEVTHVRAGNFMQNLVTVHAADIRDRDRLVVPAGDARMSYVDARDVGALAARCLAGGGHGGRAYAPTGSPPTTARSGAADAVPHRFLRCHTDCSRCARADVGV
ncbi:SDR family oxidoreductase [Pseudonocardia sichuanensis]